MFLRLYEPKRLSLIQRIRLALKILLCGEGEDVIYESVIRVNEGHSCTLLRAVKERGGATVTGLRAIVYGEHYRMGVIDNEST